MGTGLWVQPQQQKQSNPQTRVSHASWMSTMRSQTVLLVTVTINEKTAKMSYGRQRLHWAPRNMEEFEHGLIGANMNGINFFDSIKSQEKGIGCHSVSLKQEAYSSASPGPSHSVTSTSSQ